MDAASPAFGVLGSPYNHSLMQAYVPNRDEAEVPQAKILDYLLSLTHPEGRDKAVFFRRFGFRQDRWRDLRNALVEHVRVNPISSAAQKPFGIHYQVEGPLKTPDGRNPFVRTVWIVLEGGTIPQLLSAYPARRRYAQGI